MKVLLSQLPLEDEGYVNVNTASHSIFNLDGVCEDAECTEIMARVMDYVHAHRLVDTLKNWISKLRHGGCIILEGTDILELSRSLVNGNISVSDINRSLYGEIDMGAHIKSAAYNCQEICALAEEMGLVIDKKRIDGIKFVVEAHRV